MSSYDSGREGHQAPPGEPGHGGGAGPSMFAAAELFKAVAHPARAQVLELLSRGECSISELCGGTGVKATHLSRHLTQMRGQHLIQRLWSDGRLVYRLAYPEAAELLTAARSVLQARTEDAANSLRPAAEELLHDALPDKQIAELEASLVSRSVIADACQSIAARSGCSPEEAAAELMMRARTGKISLLDAAREELRNGQEQGESPLV